MLAPEITFHALRLTYASLCVAAAIKPGQAQRPHGPRERAENAGRVRHLFPDDGTTEDMAALGALGAKPSYGNVIPLHR